MNLPPRINTVDTSLRGGCLLLAALCFACPCLADELEPRSWSHLPINTNFIGGGYAYTEADIGLDPVLKLENVQMEMDTWAAKYIRTFSLLDKTARIDIMQAYQEGTWTGLLDGTPQMVTRSGWSDTLRRFAISTWALSLGFPVHRYLGIKLGYLNTRTQEATGSDSDTFALAFSSFWWRPPRQ